MRGVLCLFVLFSILVQPALCKITVGSSSKSPSNARATTAWKHKVDSDFDEPVSSARVLPRSNSKSAALIARKLQPLFFLGGSGTLAFIALQRSGLLEKLWAFVRSKGSTKQKVGTNAVVDIVKQEQEKLWSTVSAMRSTQDEIREALSSMEKRVDSSQEATSLALRSVQDDIDGLKMQLKDMEGDSRALAEAVSVDKFSSLRELESSLIAVEDRVERESAAAVAALSQLREEVPVAIEKHGQAVAQKLGKFKDDLRALVEKLASSSGSSRGKR